MKIKKRKIEINVCILLISGHVYTYILTDIFIRGVVVVVVACGCVVLGCNIYILICICLTSVTRVKCGIRSTVCWKVGNISGPT